MKKTLLTFLSVVLACVLGYAETIDLNFTAIGTDGWGNGYGATVEYKPTGKPYEVTFYSFTKQTSTVTTCPVARDADSYIIVKLTDGSTFNSIKFNFTQWGSKANTVKLEYSENGSTFTAFNPSVSGSTTANGASISATTIPDGTIAIKMTATASGKNQFGVNSIEYTASAGSTLEDPEISFTESDVTVNLGEAAPANAFSNPYNVPVKFTSSKEEVATVDPANGAVTIVAAGTTVITATSSETDTYKVATASYTLKVVDPNAKNPTLLTDLGDLDGATGYFVCSAKPAIMGNLSGTFYSSLGSDLEFNADETELTAIPEGALLLTFTKTADGYAISYENGEGNTVYMSSTAAKTMTESETEVSASITLDNNILTVKFGSNFFRYNTNAPRFTTYASGQTDVQIYYIPKPAPAPEFTTALTVGKAEYDYTAGTLTLPYSFAVVNTDAEPVFSMTITDAEGNVMDGVTLENIPADAPAAAPARAAADPVNYEGKVVATAPFLATEEAKNYIATLKVSVDGVESVAAPTEITTAVENIVVDANAPAEYFNLQGVRVANPTNGLYIRRQGSTVSKVYVR